MSGDPFGLKAEEYWSAPLRTLGDFAWKQVGDRKRGIVLGGPGEVDIEARRTLPMLAYHSDTLAELCRRPFHHAVVVATDLETGRLEAAAAEPAPDGPDAAGGGEPEPGFAGLQHLLDLRELLGLPWRPGRWMVTVLLREQQSNRVTVQLTRGRSGYVDPEVERFLASRRAPEPPRSVDPPSADPQVLYGRTPRSPALPDGIGMVIEADRVSLRRQETSARVRLSLRLPVSQRDVLPHTSAIPGPLLAARAVAPLWLVFVGSNAPGPIVQRLHVPCFDPLEGSNDEPVATGHVEFDLLQHPILRASRSQTYFVYAFSGSVMAGPAIAALVDDEALPGAG